MAKKIIFETNSAKETEQVGYDLGNGAVPGSVYCLSGDLGVGKTVFTKGFAKGLGIKEPVVSPTFTIVQVYDDGRMPLYHFDVYRIADPSEMWEVGCDDCFYGSGVSLVEWAERIEELIPENAVRITISKDLTKGFDYRKIEVEVRQGTSEGF